MDKIEWINIWYDNAWNHLDVLWVSKEGNYVTPTVNDRVWVLVDREGNLSGFEVWGVSRIKDGEVVNLELSPAEPEPTLSAEPAAGLATARLVHPHRVVQAGSTVEIKNISIHADQAGDYFEVHWAAEPDTEYTATGDDRVQALMDAAGNILGFKVSGITLMGEGERDFINADIYPAKPHS